MHLLSRLPKSTSKPRWLSLKINFTIPSILISPSAATEPTSAQRFTKCIFLGCPSPTPCGIWMSPVIRMAGSEADSSDILKNTLLRHQPCVAALKRRKRVTVAAVSVDDESTRQFLSDDPFSRPGSPTNLGSRAKKKPAQRAARRLLNRQGSPPMQS